MPEPILLRAKLKIACVLLSAHTGPADRQPNRVLKPVSRSLLRLAGGALS